jgi:putative hydrolase of the HAD superfamily
MGKYKHIFFDLDHTLWDFDKNSAETLTELYLHYQLGKYQLFSCEDFISTYRVINHEMWALYDTGMISKQKLREDRFRITLEKLGMSRLVIPGTIEEDYVAICPTKKNLIPYATEILDYLKEKYILHIITNGFSDVQGTKMNGTGLTPYFSKVFNSETVKFKKPQKEIFEYAIREVSCTADCCIMIGDNLQTDIQGAINASIDNIYFNPEKISHNYTVTHEIGCLSELAKIL